MIASLLAAVGLSAARLRVLRGKALRQARRSGSPTASPSCPAMRRTAPPRRRSRPWRWRRSPTRRQPAPTSRPPTPRRSPGSAPVRPAASPTSRSSPTAAMRRPSSILAEALPGRQGRPRRGPGPGAPLAGEGRRGRRSHRHAQPGARRPRRALAALRNAPAAAEWFRRAAELGLLDSQFNLAALYEHGDGVSRNAAEAYKWYLIAGRAGDAESPRRGAPGARRAHADARAMAERAAADFQPSAPTPSTPAASAAPGAPCRKPASPDLVTAQRALNQLGYYQGPTDGVASPALRMALAAYQRDQSLPVTGATDPPRSPSSRSTRARPFRACAGPRVRAPRAGPGCASRRGCLAHSAPSVNVGTVVTTRSMICLASSSRPSTAKAFARSTCPRNDVGKLAVCRSIQINASSQRPRAA